MTQPQNPQQSPYSLPPGTQAGPAPTTPKRRGRGRRVLLGSAGVVALLVVLAAVFGNGDDSNSAGGGGDKTAAGAPGSGVPAVDKPKPAPRQARTGQEVRDGKFAFTVTRVETGLDHVGDNEFTRQTPQGQYVLVHVTVRNIGDEAQIFDASSQKLIDAQGRQYDADSGAAAIALGDSNAFLNTINPGNSVRGILLYDVPKAFTLKAIDLHDSPFSGGVTVALTN